MRDSKKAFISTGIVLLIFVMLSGLFLAVSSPNTHNYDWYLREKLSGSLDFLIVGASHGQCALYTREIDKITGSNSYSLCYDSELNYEKYYLLNKELSRNNIKTVVLELSYATLKLSDKSGYTDANIFSIMRMDSLSDRIQYFIKKVNLNNKLYVYADLMYEGLFELLRPRNSVDEIQADLKGSRLIPGKDYTLLPEEVVDAYNKKFFSASSFNENTVKGFTDLIRLCQDYGAEVIIVVVPVSDNFLWCTDNLDEFSEWINKYCAENNVKFFDFNLLKERYTLFSDSDCYSTDTCHMSEKGSRIFSEVFANTIQEASNGENVEEFFYPSYSEMKKDSPYTQYFS